MIDPKELSPLCMIKSCSCHVVLPGENRGVFLSLMTVMRAGLSPNLETQTSLQMEYPARKCMLYLRSTTPSSEEENTPLWCCSMLGLGEAHGFH